MTDHQISLLDLSAARTARDDGIATVEANTHQRLRTDWDGMSGNCHWCGPTDQELRPYGPGGATVCAPCTFDPEHPEREQAAKNAFNGLSDAAGAMADQVVIGTEAGPQPLIDRQELGA